MISRSARDAYVLRKCTRSLDKAKFVTNDLWFGIFGLDPGVDDQLYINEIVTRLSLAFSFVLWS